VLERAVQHPRFQLGQVAKRRPARMPIEQPGQLLLREAPTPGGDEARVATQLALDRRPGHAVFEQENQTRATNLRHRSRAATL
jgi:hypothetical protein